MTTYLPHFIAALIGLLIGIEREKAHPDSPKMGVRTFVLLAFLGSLASWSEKKWLGPITTVFAFLLIVLSYFKSQMREKNVNKTVNHNLTTEIAGAIVFCLGFAANFDPIGVAFLGPLVALVLVSKKRLHYFSSRVRLVELEAAVVLFLIGSGVLGLLADRYIDPYGLFNPRKFGLLVLILAGLEFLSYIALKFLGEGRSALLIGSLGGLVSSTALFLSVSRESKDKPKSAHRLIATAIAALTASLIELLFIVGFVSQTLAIRILASAALPILCGCGLVVWHTRFLQPEPIQISMNSPLNLKGILRLALLMTAILFISGLTQKTFGDLGVQFLSFFTGTFELHGFALAISTLFQQGTLPLSLAASGLEIAIIGSLVAKIAIVGTIGHGSYKKEMIWILLILLILIIVSAVVLAK